MANLPVMLVRFHCHERKNINVYITYIVQDNTNSLYNYVCCICMILGFSTVLYLLYTCMLQA